MKVAPLMTVALVLCIACPGLIQAKKKFCMGKNGKKYAVGNGYVDTEGEVCIRYKCVKRKKNNKVFMKEKKCHCEWSDWSEWSACAATNGNATRTRTRTCSNPPPCKGGKQCSGPEEEIEECSLPSCSCSICLCESSDCHLSSNNILTTFPKLHPTFYISFEYKVNQFNNPPSQYHNIIHLTTGGNCCAMGQRIPGVWIKNSGNPTISVPVYFAVNGDGNYQIDTPFPGMSIDTWYKIEISQKWDAVTSQYKYKININGSTQEVTNTTPGTYDSVLVYASASYGEPPVDGSIRNLYINPSEDKMPDCAGSSDNE